MAAGGETPMKVWVVEEIISDGCTYTCHDFRGVFSSADKADIYMLNKMEEKEEIELIVTEHVVDAPE